MNTKLTLNIEKDLIDVAKKYAQDRHQSLSSIVQNYFAHLGTSSNVDIHDGITPNVRKISGILKLDNDYDYKEDYHNHLTEKYL